MPKPVDLTRSLENLESDYWGAPDGESYLIRACHALRRKPL